ncbi:MAG TPA: anti-sigma factor antagonist [Pseudonocardiaceae bacterium]|nr:anti-sigma factor antagonist [Pseudonocardiaceae bacterium]
MAERSFDEPAAEQLVNIDRRRVDDSIVVSVAGEIDTLTTPRLRQAVGEAIDEAAGGSVIVDLTSVTFLGSPGLAALVEAVGQAQRRGGPLRVVVDRSRPVLRPIELTGLDDVLALYETVEEALHR